MKKLTTILLLCCYAVASAINYAAPQNLSAVAYPGHVELKWDNIAGFTFDIYMQNGNKFIKQGSTDKDYFFDFYDKNKPSGRVMYLVVPNGVNPKEAKNCNISATVQSNYTDDDLLDMTERYTARYFMEFAHPTFGMARERNNNNKDIVTTGGTGFGIMALVAAANRGYYPRKQVYETINKIVNFLGSCERFHGAWAHWYDGNTGKVFHFSKYDDGGDLVETAFLMQGLLTARSYFEDGSPKEKVMASKITSLWESVEWNWYTAGSDSTLYWHWSKNYGWKMHHRIKGFDETLITYILAASSPTYPISAEVYHNGYPNSPYFFNGKSYYGIKLSLGMAYGGPLFFTHYSFLGLNPNGLHDQYADYFERNKAHVLIHRAYAIDNPNHFKGYGKDLWGFTSSDDALVGYSSHQPGTDVDNGTVSPTAALSSFPYAPEYCMDVLKNLYFNYGKKTLGPYGFYDAFNPSLPEGEQVVHSYLAIDEGPIAVMIENYRSGLLWKLFAENKEISEGLKKLGFYYQQ